MAESLWHMSVELLLFDSPGHACTTMSENITTQAFTYRPEANKAILVDPEACQLAHYRC